MKYQTEILNTRARSHGDYLETATISQALKAVTQTDLQLSPIARESLDMICSKIGRILAGDPNEPDHWDDIAGYAKLVSERIRVAQPTPQLPLGGVTGISVPNTNIFTGNAKARTGDEVRASKAVEEAMEQVDRDIKDLAKKAV